MQWISIILILFAGICNATMDVLRYRWNISIFKNWPNQQWIDPKLSWTNKWKPKSKIGDLIMSTSLVWITDLWHFTKMLMLVSIMFSIVFYSSIINWWIDVLLLYVVFTTTFELFFSIIFIKNKS